MKVKILGITVFETTEEKKNRECVHEKHPEDRETSQYRCKKCGKWVSSQYFGE